MYYIIEMTISRPFGQMERGGDCFYCVNLSWGEFLYCASTSLCLSSACTMEFPEAANYAGFCCHWKRVLMDLGDPSSLHCFADCWICRIFCKPSGESGSEFLWSYEVCFIKWRSALATDGSPFSSFRQRFSFFRNLFVYPLMPQRAFSHTQFVEQ